MKRHPFSNMYFTTTVSIMLVLLVVGLLSMLLWVSKDLADSAKEELEMIVVLSDSAQNTQKQQFMDELKKQPYTKSVAYVSKETAVKQFKESFGEDPMEFSSINPLSDSFVLQVNSDYTDSVAVTKVVDALYAHNIVSDVVFQLGLMQDVARNVNLILFVLLGLAAILIFVSILLMNNTIRLAIYSKRFLIRTMQLVGAKAWTVRKPFVVKNILMGLVASFLAALLLGGLAYYAQFELAIVDVFSNWELICVALASIFVVGILLTMMTSYVAVGRYIRMKTNDLYYI